MDRVCVLGATYATKHALRGKFPKVARFYVLLLSTVCRPRGQAPISQMHQERYWLQMRQGSTCSSRCSNLSHSHIFAALLSAPVDSNVPSTLDRSPVSCAMTGEGCIPCHIYFWTRWRMLMLHKRFGERLDLGGNGSTPLLRYRKPPVLARVQLDWFESSGRIIQRKPWGRWCRSCSTRRKVLFPTVSIGNSHVWAKQRHIKIPTIGGILTPPFHVRFTFQRAVADGDLIGRLYEWIGCLSFEGSLRHGYFKVVWNMNDPTPTRK